MVVTMGSAYKDQCIVFVTKHEKSVAVSHTFEKILSAGVIEYVTDTDKFGTFSGEVERKGTPLETVRKKCKLALKKAKADYGLASEGSFGKHPLMPMLPLDREILYFIDKPRKFELHVADSYTETNYKTTKCSSYEEVTCFAEKALFPSHALIIRSSPRDKKKPFYKGLSNFTDLENAYLEALKCSSDGQVLVETDMRANFNPTRMRMIEKLGIQLANRLSKSCPDCRTPGWGKVDSLFGLPCGGCGHPTDELSAVINGCQKCSRKEVLNVEEGKFADPLLCMYCNP